MIPRIQTGTSFKGAGLYYLHDKRLEGEAERLTDARVAWTYAINTLENEPEAVLAEMRRTAFDQQLLKRLAGNRSDGRPTEKTVMTIALAWSPEQSPSKNDMIEAGHSYLQHMGWEAHQVLFVAHNDTKHPHVHLIVNRVHPETGMTLDDGWAKIRTQKWALAYERENGRIYCEAREAKYSGDKDRNAQHMTHREWRMWQEIAKENALDPDSRKALASGEWDVLKGAQRDSRDAYWKETFALRKQLRSALREEVATEFANEWTAYAKHRATAEREAKLYDREARRGIRALRRAGETRTVITETVKGKDGRSYRKRRGIESPGIERIKQRRAAYHTRHREELWQMRKEILKRQKERLEFLANPALEKLSADRNATYKTFLAEQRTEKSDLRDDQKQGKRRHDLLSKTGRPQAQATLLTSEQLAAYTLEALRKAAAKIGFKTASKETGQATAKEAPATTRTAAKETTDRQIVQTDKDRARDAKRKADVDYYLQKRADDRARDRGGGRDR